MNTTVHILNGDSTISPIKESGLSGDLIVWREMLCEGDLIKDVGSDAFWLQRYHFFENELKVNQLEYYDKIIKELIQIEDLSSYKEVVLWFEYDLFCQVNLLALCTYLLKYYRKDIFYHLVCVGKEKCDESWKTLANYSPEEYLNLYESKVKLSRNDLIFAKECWDVYVENNENTLRNFDFKRNRKFKYLHITMKQHLQRFKNKEGFNEIDRKILALIDSNELNEMNIVKELLLWQQKETVYGFGDLQYFMQLNKLKDFYYIKDDAYFLNEKGKIALANK